MIGKESFFFGQRGAGITVNGVIGTTDFGHPNGFIGTSGGEMYGEGRAETDMGGGNYIEENLSHVISVEFYEDFLDSYANIFLGADLLLNGGFYTSHTVTVSNNDWVWRSYADAWAKTVLNINPGSGEVIGQAVRIHVNSFADSDQWGIFDTETGLAGTHPNNFRVLLNDELMYDAGAAFYSPNGDILDLYRVFSG